MQIARRQEDVDAGAVGNCSARAAISMSFGLGAGQRSDARLRMACVMVAMAAKSPSGGHGEAGLDDVHAQVLQGMGHG